MSVREFQKYISTPNLAIYYDCSPEYFLNNIKEFIQNKHYIRKGKFIRWDLEEVDNYFRNDTDETTPKSEDDLMLDEIMLKMLK